jgi:hypothetical protein
MVPGPTTHRGRFIPVPRDRIFIKLMIDFVEGAPQCLQYIATSNRLCFLVPAALNIRE